MRVTQKYHESMKNFATLITGLVLTMAFAVSALATPPPPSIPDGGSTALLVVLAAFGLTRVKKLLR